MDWYYVDNGRRIGPVDDATFETLVRAGAVRPATLIWRDGMADWQPYSSARPEGAGAPQTAAALPYAGFWIRAVAKLVDGSILWAAGALLASFAGPLLYGRSHGAPSAFWDDRPLVLLLQVALAATYDTAFLGRFGATPGKMAAGLKVTAPEGGPIAYGTALCRYFAEILSGLTLGIGYLMVAVDARRRALHDRICRTRVVLK